MRKNLILIVVLVLALGATGYIWFNRSGQGEAPIEATGPSGTRLSDLRRLKTLELDTSILEDPFFLSLEAGPEIVNTGDTKPGRANPFLGF